MKNAVSQLRRAGAVEDTGDTEPGGGRVVTVVEPDRNRHRTFKGDDDDYDVILSKERAVEALREGNAPRMALANYRKGVQDFQSVVKSVLVFWHKDTSRWQDAAENVLAAVEGLVKEAGE